MDNIKTYDTCKEVKIASESNETIPDVLLARLLKLWLLLSKQEGVEIKIANYNANAATNTNGNALVTENNEDKKGKKDEKKDDRVKSPGLLKKPLKRNFFLEFK